MGEVFGVETSFQQCFFAHRSFSGLVVMFKDFSVLLKLKVYLLKEGVFRPYPFLVMVARFTMVVTKQFINPSFYLLVAGQTGMWV
jgi:hypothetical protein